MKLSTLFSIFGIVSLILGIVLLLFPNQMMSLLGISSLDNLSVMLIRFIGGFTLSLGMMSWFVRDAEASKARDAIILGLTLGNAIAAIIIIWSALSGIFTFLIWVEAALFVLFAAAFFFVGRANMSSA